MSRNGSTDASCLGYEKLETICDTIRKCKCSQVRLDLLWVKLEIY